MSCKECGGVKFTFDEILGEKVCDACGLVIIEEIFERVSDGGITSFDVYGNKLDASKEIDSGVGGLGSKVGIHGYGPDNFTNKRVSRRLRRTERYSSPRRGRTINKGIQQCLMVASEYPTTPQIREQIKRNYLNLFNGHHLGGSTYEDRAGAIVFYTLKDNGIRVNLKEVAAYSGTDKNRIHKLSRKIARVFGKPWVLSQINPISDFEKYSQDLGEDFDLTKDCIKVYSALAQLIEHNTWIVGIPLLSGIIYLTVLLTNRNITQNKICITLGTTAVTLRSHLNNICRAVGVDKKQLMTLTLEEFTAGVIR
jgi:transcription initiation factor TFIIIB Brf1 subunit/transcription initiation factor TFIIB